MERTGRGHPIEDDPLLLSFLFRQSSLLLLAKKTSLMINFA